MQLSKNAIGNLINRYKAVLKKCHLLNTFGSLAVASLLVAGSVGMASANSVNISGTGVVDKAVSLQADAGSPAEGDQVTTAENTSGTFNLNIDGRKASLGTMTIGSLTLAEDLTVTLKEGVDGVTEITSTKLSIVADNTIGYDTTYKISDGLTQINTGAVNMQGSAAGGVARLEVDGTLILDTSATGGTATIERTRGDIADSQVHVTGTLSAVNGTAAADLKVNGVALTLDGATVNAASLDLDFLTNLNVVGTAIINGTLNAANTITLKDNSYLDLKSGGNLEALVVGGPNNEGLGNLTVDGDGMVVSVNNFEFGFDGGRVAVYSGATFDISADDDISSLLTGEILLDGGTLRVKDLIVSSHKLEGSGLTGDVIHFLNNPDSLLLVEETLTLGGNGILDPGVNIETKTLVGNITGASPVTLATVESGASITFSGGGFMGMNVAANGVVNIQGSDTAGVTNAVNQTSIADKTLTVNTGSVVNVQDNGVLVLQGAKRLTLNTGGELNIANDGTLLLNGSFDFDGKNITTIAGTVIEVLNATAPTFDYQDIELANVNIQGGAKLGSISLEESIKDTVTTLLSGTISIDANSTGDNAAAVLGILEGDGVTTANFAGTLNVSDNYLSRTGNTWGTVGNGGILNIANIADFYAGANDVFNVAFNAGTVQVYGGNAGDGDASVTVNAGGSLGADGATGTSLWFYGGDADDTTSGDNAIFTVSGSEFTVNGNIEFLSGIDTAAHKGGSAILHVLGGAGSDATHVLGEDGTDAKLTITGNILGTGTLNLQGGEGGNGTGSFAGGRGGDAIIELKGTTADTVTFTYTGGTGGLGGDWGGVGGTGGTAIITANSGSYDLTGGTGGMGGSSPFTGGAGGTGGAVVLKALGGAASGGFGTITLNGGAAGSPGDGNFAAAGAGGEARFDVINTTSSADSIIMHTAVSSVVNVTGTTAATTLSVGEIDGTVFGAQGVINIAGTDAYTATLTVTGSDNSYIDTDTLEVNIGLNGTLDLSALEFGNLQNFLSGAYNLDGGTLNVGGLRIDAADLVSGAAAAGEIGFVNGGKLDVDGLLTIRNVTTTAQLNDGVHMETQSLEGNLTGSDSVTHILLGQDGSTVGSTLTFSGDNASTSDVPVSNININLTINDAGKMVVGYTLDDAGAVSMGTTTLKADNTLTVNASGGLNVQYGATLDVSNGTLVVANNGFMKVDPDVVIRPSVLGTGGLGTLIVDNDNLGLTALEGTINYDDANNKVDDAFWGALEVTGMEGDAITYEEYSKFLVDGENALIQGKNATLEFVNVKIDGLVILSELEGGAVIRDVVAIGDGVVDHGGTIIVGSVFGNNKDSIVIDAGSDLSITGEPRGGALFTQIGAASVQVKDGTLRLGGDATDGTASVTTNPLILDTDIVLGDMADSSIEGDVASTGHVFVYGDLDMSSQTISSLAGTSGNTVNVLSGATLKTSFDMLSGDSLNVTAGTKSATVTMFNGSILGDIHITGGAQSGANAIANITDSIVAKGDVNLTSNVGDAILNIVGANNGGATAALGVSKNLNNNGILNITGGNAGASGHGGYARLDVIGTLTSTSDITLTGGDALGAYNGGMASVTLNNAKLANVNIISGTNTAAGNSGLSGSAALIIGSGSVQDLTVTNDVVGRSSAMFIVPIGAVTANSVTLNATSNADNSLLQVLDGGVLNVTTLDASAGSLNVLGGDLFVNGTYTETAETIVTISKSQTVGRSQANEADGIFDLSDTTTNRLIGQYNVETGGTLQMGRLNIGSANLVSGTANAGQVGFSGGTLVTETLNLTDAGAASLDNGVIVTESLDTTHNVGVTINTDLTFSGGGIINTNVTTGSHTVTIGAVAGVDGGETSATTTALGKGMTLNINKNAGLLIREGNALNTTAGALKVVAGGFDIYGTGQLVASNVDFGKFNLNATTTAGLIDKNGANVQDLYFGDLVVTGLTGTMNQEEYESFLIAGNNALIIGGNATLKFDGVSVAYADDIELRDLAPGTNAEDQTFKTGAPTAGNTVDVNNGGKVTVGGVEQSDPDNPVDLNIKTGTTLVATGQGEAQGNAFDRDVNVEQGAGFKTGAANGQYTANVGGSVTLESESSSGAGDGGNYTALGDTNIKGDITASGTGGGQEVKVEAGASLTVSGDINVPKGSMNVQPSGTVVATDVTLDSLTFGDTLTGGQTAGGMTVKNLTVNKGLISSGKVSITGIANIGDFTVGSPASQGSYSAHKTIISGIFGFDPNWNAEPTLNTMAQATQGALGTVTFDTNAAGNVGIYVGRNSMVAIGTSDTSAFMQDMQQLVNNGVVSWGNPVNNTNNTSAAIAFYEGLSLTSNASLVVNGTYVNAADGTNPAGVWNYEGSGVPVIFNANTASFAAYSLALINAPAFLATDSVVLTAGAGSELTVNDDAKLVIADGKGGQYINVAEGFDTATIEKDNSTGEIGWTNENLISSSSLIGAEVVNPTATGVPSAYVDSDFLVYLYSKDANVIYPALNKSMGNHINTMVEEIGTNVHSLNMGQRFISRLTDDSGVYGFGSARATEVASIIESSAQIAQVGAVGRVTIDAAMSAGNASIARNTFSELGSNAQNVAAVHMDAKGGISTGSKADGMKNGFGMWLMPLYKWNTVSGYEAGSFEHDYTSGLGGLAIGADYTVNNMFRFGVNFNLGAGYADSSGDLSKTNNDFDFWGLGVYGAFSKNNFNLVADLGYSTTYNELNQKVPSTLGMGSNNVEVNASAFTLGLTAEYVIKTDVVDIIPHVGVRFVSVTTDAYDVKNGGGTVFNVESETQNVWYFPVGITFQKEVTMDNGWHFTPKLDLGFIAAAGDLGAISKASIPGVSGAAELEMQNVDGFAFNGGLGFNLGNDVITFGVNYNIQASEHEASHMISGTFRFEF